MLELSVVRREVTLATFSVGEMYGHDDRTVRAYSTGARAHPYAREREEPRSSGCRVFVHNLAFSTSWQDLKDHARQARSVGGAQRTGLRRQHVLHVHVPRHHLLTHVSGGRGGAREDPGGAEVSAQGSSAVAWKSRMQPCCCFHEPALLSSLLVRA